MKKVYFIFALIELLIGCWWCWCADNWRVGCLVAPFAMVAVAVIACGIIESKEQ